MFNVVTIDIFADIKYINTDPKFEIRMYKYLQTFQHFYVIMLQDFGTTIYTHDGQKYYEMLEHVQQIYDFLQTH